MRAPGFFLVAVRPLPRPIRREWVGAGGREASWEETPCTALRQRRANLACERKPAGAGGKRWGGRVEEKGGGASVPSEGLRPAAAFYLLAQGYLECLACLALRVADFSAVHTDLSSGSPGAEGCSGNSQRSFSSETQKRRQWQRVRETQTGV